MRAILLSLSVLLASCSVFGPVHETPAKPLTPIQRAQQSLNEANAILTAVNLTIKQQVEDKAISKADAQSFLDEAKSLGRQVDLAQDSLKLGVGDLTTPETQLELVRGLQRRLHQRIGK